jgi:hypothetical protein
MSIRTKISAYPLGHYITSKKYLHPLTVINSLVPAWLVAAWWSSLFLASTWDSEGCQSTMALYFCCQWAGVTGPTMTYRCALVISTLQSSTTWLFTWWAIPITALQHNINSYKQEIANFTEFQICVCVCVRACVALHTVDQRLPTKRLRAPWCPWKCFGVPAIILEYS